MSYFQGLNHNKLLLAPKVDQVLQKKCTLQSRHLSILSITRYHLFSICSLLQWYFSYLDYATVPYNNILDNIANGNTHKLKGFLCCYRSNKNHLECTHSLRQSCESPHQTESPISLYKDSQTYNSSFSKDTRVYV